MQERSRLASRRIAAEGVTSCTRRAAQFGIRSHAPAGRSPSWVVERFVDYPRGRGVVPEPGMRSMPALQALRAAAQSRCQGVAVATAGTTTAVS